MDTDGAAHWRVWLSSRYWSAHLDRIGGSSSFECFKRGRQPESLLFSCEISLGVWPAVNVRRGDFLLFTLHQTPTIGILSVHTTSEETDVERETILYVFFCVYVCVCVCVCSYSRRVLIAPRWPRVGYYQRPGPILNFFSSASSSSLSLFTPFLYIYLFCGCFCFYWKVPPTPLLHQIENQFDFLQSNDDNLTFGRVHTST